MEDLTVITPTRDRPAAFSLCRRWMASQTFRGSIQWIVVDDGDIPIDSARLSDYIRRPPSVQRNTLPGNLKEAILRTKSDRIVFVEDDDYYAPGYLAMMAERLKKECVLGEIAGRYYNVKMRRPHTGSETSFSSLCRTGFRKEATQLILKAVEETERAGDVSVDKRFWALAKNANIRCGLFREPKMMVSIKGLPGRAGLGQNHADSTFPRRDPKGIVLEGWIGKEPASHYWSLFR
jgi:glycosyltransferase involved in cell wall biosynthesis